MFPPADKTESPIVFQLSLADNVELRDFGNTHRGNFMDRMSLIKIRFQQLENDGVYTIFGPTFMARETDARTAKISKKMQEMSALMAVKKDLEGKCALHLNMNIFGNHNQEILVESIEKDDKFEAKAYICDFSAQPSDEDIKVIREKVDKFEQLAKKREPFQSVSQVIPVLSGLSWHPEVAERAKKGNVWRVQRGPAETLKVFRNFSTAARRVIRMV